MRTILQPYSHNPAGDQHHKSAEDPVVLSSPRVMIAYRTKSLLLVGQGKVGGASYTR